MSDSIENKVRQVVAWIRSGNSVKSPTYRLLKEKAPKLLQELEELDKMVNSKTE